MLEHAQRPEVGVVGAKLLYPNEAVQHAGVVLGIGGVAGHVFKRYPPGHTGPVDLIDVVRDVSAVTFACAMMRRGVYEEVGGLDAEHLPVSFNDVDFCLRVRHRGYRLVYTPYAVLYHHESASRWELPSSAPGEVAFMKESWAGVLRADPYYNRNLTRTREDFSLGVVDDPGWTS
jgi:GT2 family glycosyltransferase